MIWFRFSFFFFLMSNEIILFQILYKHLKYLFLSLMKLRIVKFILDVCHVVATPLWVEWEDETPTPKVGDLESSGTPECL